MELGTKSETFFMVFSRTFKEKGGNHGQNIGNSFSQMLGIGEELSIEKTV